MKESHRKNISGATKGKNCISNRSHLPNLQRQSFKKPLENPSSSDPWFHLDEATRSASVGWWKIHFFRHSRKSYQARSAGFPSWWTGWHPFSLLSTTLGWAQGLLCCETVPKMKSLTMVRPWISSKSWTSTCVSDQRDVFFAQMWAKSQATQAILKQLWCKFYIHTNVHFCAFMRHQKSYTCVCCIQ